jgi:biotin transport system ATP-binding protein
MRWPGSGASEDAPGPTGIRFEQVSHAYDARPVLHEVDLMLTERRIGLVGANGSGKSTLARMINGLVLPTSGRVLVDGLDTSTRAAAVRRRVGFVFTDPDAQIVMPTVGEDVAFSLRRSGLDRTERAARVLEALARFGLADHVDHPAHLLSGGQKQLLALTSVLITSPRVLVCDEPTTLLDARNARRVGDLLAGLQQQVVLVTHHLEQLESFDRVLVVEEGRLVADAAPEQALAAYRALVR